MPVEQGVGLRCGLQGEGGPHRDGVVLPDQRTGGLAEGEEVALQVVGNGGAGGLVLEGLEGFEVEDAAGVSGGTFLNAVVEVSTLFVPH